MVPSELRNALTAKLGDRAGDHAQTAHAGALNTLKRIGQGKYPPLVLKQGFAGPEFFSKHQAFNKDDGKPRERFNGTIIQYGPGKKPAHSWTFKDAWISKWEGPEFDASKNEISIETIEIVHEGLTHKGG